ncbi:serine/threonine protein kinase [Tolypothrix sp. VBCCA 56010]|uniref:serine/threonine protein kinase n=1 Tax=Tolypothrix sp. VBCCA 56010 TaxID=3137731 RepID=UPI003D7DA3F0
MKDRVLNARYEVVQQLGKNAGRQTLLARDLKTQELVVVKLLLFSNDFEWQHLKLFEREAETLKAISHRAIPSYLNYFELDSPNGKGFALVQTYVEGKSLDEHLKAGRTFSEVEVKEIAIALLSILIYLHGRQPPVIHRDIKPSNILLTNCSGNSVGEVHLVDFGSVQTLAAKEGGTITVVGTYGYMPPEQFGGRTVPASDLYSLGATLIALVTGSHPADLPQKDGRIQFEQVANLSPAFANWLRCMCEPSLDRRSTSAFEALQALEQEQLTKNSAPLVVHKPPGSKILLTKDANSLEILIPAKGLNFDTGLWFFIALLYFTVLAGLIVSQIKWYFVTYLLYQVPQQIISSIFLVLTYAWMFTFIKAIFLLANSFTRVRLRINQQKFFLTSELFDGYKYRNFQGLRQAISHLEYVKRSFKKGCRGKLQCQIIVWIGGTQTFTLGNYGRLTEPELNWLAYELSDWLKLPITTE